MTAYGTEKIIPILNPKAQYEAIREEIDAAIHRVLDRQRFIPGVEVAALEQEIAAFCRTPHAVGVASATDALLLALKAAGVGPGDEVIVPAFTCVATADTVSRLEAIPMFADIDPLTCTMDPDRLESLLTVSSRAIVPVHLYGQPAAMRQIRKFAALHGLSVVGDAAQALGATCDGAPIASTGDYGCLSFSAGNPLGGYGDGGMIVTHDAERASYLRMFRSHGSAQKHTSEFLGWNSRLDELQAAILRAKLPHLEHWNMQRRERAARYHELLGDVEGIMLPVEQKDSCHVYHQYTIRLAHRDEVQVRLLQAGVQTAVDYPVPLHLQPTYQYLGHRRGDLPAAEAACRTVLSLPIYPELTEDDMDYIVATLKRCVQAAQQRS